MGYFHKTINAVTWTFIGRWLIRGFTLLRIGILARILTPVQFGIFGIVTLVLGFLETFTETSVNVFLVQEHGKINSYLNTAWVISIVRGLLMGTIILFSASGISTFFSSPNSYAPLLILSLVPIFRGFINPSVINMQKNLLFKNETFFRLSVFLVDFIVSVLVSLITKNAFGLVAGMVAGACVEFLLSFILFSPRPRLTFNSISANKIFQNSKWVTTAGILNYFFQNGDNIVVGKILGEYSLGLYSNAYKISSTPISEISDVVSKVTFPVFVDLSSHVERLKKAFLKTFMVIFSTSLLLSLTVFCFADPIVGILLGPAWSPAVPVLRVLAIYGFCKSITNSTFPLLLALRRQNYVTLITFISFIILAITLVPFIKIWGIVGAGISASLGAMLALPVSLISIRKVFFSLHAKSN